MNSLDWRGFMRFLTYTLLVSSLVLMTFSVNAQQRHLKKGDISRVKIVSPDEDNIHLYLIDQQDQTYRVPSLNQKKAQQLLNQLNDDLGVKMQTSPVKHRSYMQVDSWQ